ncbi:BlaI/MecI/CopY family transcriptional regulator [Streptomyces sp. NPDC003038]|uniref:BlaI/MecI/CopY family transcriptional regulator n=1 Tax=Streptomyces sp. NPDC003038 TaxID=3154546 RepID=UPI0033AFCE0F
MNDDPGTRALRVRRGRGELNASVLAALGRAPGPVTAGWVRQHVDPALAYTTVPTTLTRLKAASTVVRCRLGGAVVWSAVNDGARLSLDEERWLRTRLTACEAARPGAGLPARRSLDEATAG